MNAFLVDHMSGLSRIGAAATPGRHPLVVAIHGGSYSSRYFDVPGYSLLDRAAANAIPIIAFDRPGYGQTPALADGAGFVVQAAYLRRVLRQAWDKFGTGCAGMVLIGHSIGGAIAALIAGDPGDLPLIGIAISGIGLRTPPQSQQNWAAMPDQIAMPDAVKDQLMFGPAGSYDAQIMPAASYPANCPAPKAELIDIVSTWQNELVAVLGRITVPVHYRQAQGDRLWVVDEDQVAGFARALARSARVDAALVRGTGHCMDFHHVSAGFQLQQLGFALQCAAQSG